MIFNAATQGGIREEDINAALLQSLDPDFIADNIARGVDLFGLVGTLSGAKVASGTVAGSGTTTNTITVTGLGFKPSGVVLAKNDTAASNGVPLSITDGVGIYYSSGYKSRSVSVSTTDDGFSVTDSTTVSAYWPRGNYRWVAWAV